MSHSCINMLGKSRLVFRKASILCIPTLKRTESNSMLKCITVSQKCFRRSIFSHRFNGRSWFPGMKLAMITMAGMGGIGCGIYSFLVVQTRDYQNLTFPSAQLDDHDVPDAPQNDDTNEETNSVSFPSVKVSRSVPGPVTNAGISLTLFQYQNCPFCCKVRAFLDFHGLPYDIVEVNPVLRQQIKFSKYKKVPIVIVQGEDKSFHQLEDSTVIISTLKTFLRQPKEGLNSVLEYYKPVTYNNEEGTTVTEVMNRYFIMYGEQQIEDAYKEQVNERYWRRWVDNELVHVLSPNIYRTWNEALEAFNYFSQAGDWEKNFNGIERSFVIYVGATAMYFVGKRLKKKYHLKDDVRESLYDACIKWTSEVGTSKFMGGELPNLADLAVYGVLSSIEGCSAFRDVLNNTNIGVWYGHMQTAVRSHIGTKELSWT